MGSDDYEGFDDVREVGGSRWGRTIALMIVAVVLAVALVVIVYVGLSVFSGGGDDKPRNMIFIIADGYGPASATYAREMGTFDSSNEKPLLPLDKYLVGHARTFSSDMVITDSAAGATAYSCGLRTYNNGVGVMPDGTACANFLEAAKRTKYVTGIVTTTRVTHATPAAMSVHMGHRNFETDIATQQAYNATGVFDLMFGGGRDKFSTDSLQALSNKGYNLIYNKNELATAALPVVGLFADDHIDYQVDLNQEPSTTQPTLSQMSKRALELLSNNPDDKPFILFLEAGKIDLAAHSNDAAAHYWEINEYMKTIQVVEDFLAGRDDTAVITTADHSTGGISTGRDFNNDTYPVYTWFPLTILRVNASMERIAERQMAGEDLEVVYKECTGIDITTQDGYGKIAGMQPSTSVLYTSLLAEPVNSAALIGWTTTGHTGEDVNVYNLGIRLPQLDGVVDNIDLGNLVADVMDLTEEMETIQKGYQGWVFSYTNPPASKRYKYRYHD